MKHPRRGTLAFRLYALGMAQLALLAAAVAFVGYLIGPPHMARRGRPPPPPELGMRGPPEPPPPGGPAGPWTPLLTFFVSGLVIVGVGSFLTARWILTPLDRLSGAARALGEGNLDARAGLTREDELGELGRAFDDMAARIRALLLAEKELLANVSHELRTPLARIRVVLELAAEGDPARTRAFLAEISSDLTELESLLKDVLTGARLEIADGGSTGATLAPQRREMAPAAIAERAADRFRATHASRALDVTVPDGLPLVHVDPVLFRRAVDNLLENADRYSPDPKTPVSLSVRGANGSVEFVVTDHGMGIAKDDLPLVFTPFFRAERSRSRDTGGVGLGLALVKRIVLAHDGTVSVDSELGSGTTVRVSIPAARSSQHS